MTTRKKPLNKPKTGVLSPNASAIENTKHQHQLKVETSRFEGPIPSPEIFKLYAEIIPDAPERILAVFEQDSKHVRDIEMGALNAQKNDNKRVHYMAWSLVMTGFVMSGVFAWLNKDALALVTLGTTIGAILYSFLRRDVNPK